MTEHPDSLSLRNRIGISCHVSPADYEELAHLALSEGFSVYELSVGNFGCADPLWPRTCRQAQRSRIRDLLAPFAVRILRATSEAVHSQ